MVIMVKRNSKSFDIPAAENPSDVELMNASDNNTRRTKICKSIISLFCRKQAQICILHSNIKVQNKDTLTEV